MKSMIHCSVSEVIEPLQSALFQDCSAEYSEIMDQIDSVRYYDQPNYDKIFKLIVGFAPTCRASVCLGGSPLADDLDQASLDTMKKQQLAEDWKQTARSNPIRRAQLFQD
uniref:Uncharacterized protein n=1 Tax=Acrobeloides nanus TaxID=290746 RepID=A0A914DHC4_9BILA